MKRLLQGMFFLFILRIDYSNISSLFVSGTLDIAKSAGE